MSEPSAVFPPSSGPRLEAVPSSPLPDAGVLAGELRRLREKGLLRAGELSLPALDAVTRLIDDSDRPIARRREAVVRKALERMGSEELGEAAGTLFGLARGTIGTRPTDLRERAAEIYGLSAETFRKDRERRILARLADELVQLAGESPVEVSVAGSAPSGLPPENRVFVGRAEEIDEVTTTLTRPGRPRVCVVHGLAGVGKTALTVRAAGRLAPFHPGGTLFVDLAGHRPDRPPERPADVLDRLLRKLSVDPGSIPAHLDDKRELWLSRLADRRVLLVLDNARDVAQVLPLLPPAPRCSVIISSRTRLTGLDEAHHLHLRALPRDQAVDLFAQVADLPVDESPSGVLDSVVEQCSGLPLAVRIVAARHRLSRFERLEDLLARLRDESARLTAMDDGSRSVSAAFAVSSDALPDDAPVGLHLLGVHPGPELGVADAAALLGCPAERARWLLDLLVERNLLEQTGESRYRFHDLVADFVRRQAAEHLGDEVRGRAFRRLADDCLARVVAADEQLTPQRFRVEADLRYPPARAPYFDGYQPALEWTRENEALLVAVCRAAGERGFDVSCWQLAYLLRGYFFIAKSWPSWEISYRAALASAVRLGDSWAEATITNNLGLSALEQDRTAEAAEYYRRAGQLFDRLGDESGRYTAQANLSWVSYAEGRYEQFLDELGQAYAYYRRTANARNAAISLRGLALGEIRCGRPEVAIGQTREAIVAFRELGLPFDETIALNNLGEACAAAGRPGPARESFGDALRAASDCGSDFEAARAQMGLAALDEAAGDAVAARERKRAALRLYRKLGAPQALALGAELESGDDESAR